MPDRLDRIKQIGFTRAGSWSLDGATIVCELVQHASARNILYAFVIEDCVLYIGKSVRSLCTRMCGYRSPEPTQSTNVRNNRNIRKALERGQLVEVFVLPDNGLLHYGGFHVNLAAGLEDSLIKELKPAWNGGRKEPSRSADAKDR